MDEQQPIAGHMLLYERPELLTREEHGHLGLRTLPEAFSFARHVRGVPLMVSEVRSAQRFCPIVFSDDRNPVPIAVLGVLEGRNLFVDDDGAWEVPGYVPAYLRCYPFALATAGDDRLALVVDRAADQVSDRPDVPFFGDDGLSAAVQERLELCRTYEAERQRTQAFCQMLVRHGLLVRQEARHAVDGSDEQIIARYFVIDPDRLMALDKDTIDGLFRDGSLGVITAHLFSLDNFDELMRKRSLRASA